MEEEKKIAHIYATHILRRNERTRVSFCSLGVSALCHCRSLRELPRYGDGLPLYDLSSVRAYMRNPALLLVRASCIRCRLLPGVCTGTAFRTSHIYFIVGPLRWCRLLPDPALDGFPGMGTIVHCAGPSRARIRRDSWRLSRRY